MTRNLGRHTYGIAAIVLGLIGLWWRDFATTWQPVPPDIPGRSLLAVSIALLLILAGFAVQFRRSMQVGAVALGAIYLVFVLLWLNRAIGLPFVFGMWLGTAEQLALVVGAAVIVTVNDLEASRSVAFCRLLFGICLLAFGTAHFIYVSETAAMVPAWLPPTARFWALATGAAHVLGGIALLLDRLAWLAARLVTAMFVIFGLLVWLPQLAANPSAHLIWGGNAVNFALVGAAWVLADAISISPATRELRSPVRRPARL